MWMRIAACVWTGPARPRTWSGAPAGVPRANAWSMQLRRGTGRPQPSWLVCGRAGSSRPSCWIAVSGVLFFLSRHLEGGCGRIGPGQELVETALGMAVDDAADHVGQVGPGFDADQLAGLNQRRNHRPVRGSAVRARKERIFSG